MSLKANDVNDDGNIEIIAGGYDGVLWIVSNNGTLLFEYNTQNGYIGSSDSGKSQSIDSADVNADGILDVGFIIYNDSVFTAQTVNCVAEFNDSSVYNMAWNNEIRKWEINRTFTTAGVFEYNVTCEKGGYETGFASSEIVVGANSAPVINEMNVTPLVAYTNSTLRCFANVTDDLSASINTTFVWYKYNSTFDWELFGTDVVEIVNNTIDYSGINISWNETHHGDKYACSVRATDGIIWSNWINETRVIGNYSTQLILENGTDNPVQFEEVMFYANYSTVDMGVSGVGLENFEIGSIIWNTVNLTEEIYSTAFIDLNGDGKRQHVIFGTDAVAGGNETYIYYKNGSLFSSLNTGDAENMLVASFDTDERYNDIVIGINNGYGKVYNSSLDQQMITSMNQAHQIAIYDFNNDSRDDVIFANSEGTNIEAYYHNGTQIWNYTNDPANVPSNVNEILITNFNFSTPEPEILAIGGGVSDIIIYDINGTRLNNVSHGSGAHYAVTTADLDQKGINDYLLVSYNADQIRVYDNDLTFKYYLWNQYTGERINVLISDDFDGDGFVNDFIMDFNSTVYMLNATNTTSEILYNFSTEGMINDVLLKDINDDGIDEVLVISENGYFNILNLTLDFIQNVNVNSPIGSYRRHNMMDFSDINDDGITDISLTTLGGIGYILTESKCMVEFNDSSSYNMTWNETLRKWEINKSFSSSGVYGYNVTCEKGGYETGFTESQITVGSNTAPIINQVNITPTLGYVNSTFNCSTFAIDNESANFDVEFSWLINNVTNSSWDTTVLCANNTWCYTDDYPTGILKHYNITCQARAFDGTLFSDWSNSSEVEIQNSLPLNVTLHLPTDNSTLIARDPFFNWSISSDIDNDNLTYNLIVDNTRTFDFAEINISTNETYYNSTFDLKLNTYYYWYVKVYDGENWSMNSSIYNFTILSAVMISLPNNSINFGLLDRNQSNDTTTENPYPFIVQNDGNTPIEILINSTALWNSVNLNTNYFQVKTNQSNETGAFNWTGSAVSWINITNQTTIIDNLNYSNSNDTAKIDIRVLVPMDEPKGAKSATIDIYAIEN